MSKLSELLERIRPAGTPGASAEGERVQRRGRRMEEIDDIVTLLLSFESEATAVVDTAERRAAASIRDAEERARETLADLPQQLARAEAAILIPDASPGAAEIDMIAADTAAEVERLESVSAERIDDLSRNVIELIWSAFSPAEPSKRST